MSIRCHHHITIKECQDDKKDQHADVDHLEHGYGEHKMSQSSKNVNMIKDNQDDLHQNDQHDDADHLEHGYCECVAGRVVGEAHLRHDYDDDGDIVVVLVFLFFLLLLLLLMVIVIVIVMVMTKSSPSFSLIGGWRVRQN